MRKTILILFIFIGSSLSFAQDNNISIKEYNYEYYHYYGTEKTYVWNLVITNNSTLIPQHYYKYNFLST